MKRLVRKGASLFVVVQKIDTSTIQGKMLLPLFSMLAELEIDLKRDWAAAGVRIAYEL